MTFLTSLVAALEKLDKFEGSARDAFLHRLGQLEEDVKADDSSSIPYTVALLIKFAEQSDPSCAYALRTCAARLTEGKTRLNVLNDLNVLDAKASKNKQSDLAFNNTGIDRDEEFERDFSRLPLLGQELITRWNGILSLPRVKTLRGRLTTIKRAFSSSFFNLNWSEGLSFLARSKFLTGGGSRRWKADIDWFLDPKNLEAIMSGKYSESKTDTATTTKKYDKESI